MHELTWLAAVAVIGIPILISQAPSHGIIRIRTSDLWIIVSYFIKTWFIRLPSTADASALYWNCTYCIILPQWELAAAHRFACFLWNLAQWWRTISASFTAILVFTTQVRYWNQQGEFWHALTIITPQWKVVETILWFFGSSQVQQTPWC